MYDPSVSDVGSLSANCIFEVTPSIVGVSFVHARPIATLNMINWGEIGYVKINIKLNLEKDFFFFFWLTTNEPHTTAKASSGASCFPK